MVAGIDSESVKLATFGWQLLLQKDADGGYYGLALPCGERLILSTQSEMELLVTSDISK